MALSKYEVSQQNLAKKAEEKKALTAKYQSIKDNPLNATKPKPNLVSIEGTPQDYSKLPQGYVIKDQAPKITQANQGQPQVTVGGTPQVSVNGTPTVGGKTVAPVSTTTVDPNLSNPNVDYMSIVPPQNKPTVATTGSPVMDKGAPTTNQTDYDTKVAIALKKAKGETLTDDEITFLIKDQMKKSEPIAMGTYDTTKYDYDPTTGKFKAGGQEVDVTEVFDTSTVGGAASAQKYLAQQQALEASNYAKSEEERLKGTREGQLLEQKKLLDADAARAIRQTQEAGARQQESVQSALSFSGFGRSTYNADKQAEISADTAERERLIQSAADAQYQAYKASLENADSQTVRELQMQATQMKNQAAQLELQTLGQIAELNIQNKVTADEALNNLIQGLGQVAKESIDYDLTKTISDGYLYKIGATGIPERVKDSSGNEIKTGVVGEGNLQFNPPQQDVLGNAIGPAYIFDKNTGDLIAVDTQTGERTKVQGGANAMANFKNFDEYSKGIGNGTVVSGSPYHKGFEVDIDGEIGDIVPAFTSGKVVKVESNKGGFGNSVVVEDSDGNQVRYAHLNLATVKIGDNISAGQMIGQMGKTGNVIPGPGGNGSHLHIEAKDKKGNLISLSNFSPSNTWQTPQYGGGNDAMWSAEAFMKGYTTPQQVALYVQAKKQGQNPPDVSQGAKPLSGEASKLTAIATTGLQNANDFEKAIDALPDDKLSAMYKFNTDPKIQTLIDQLADKIGRLRSGGAINKEEEARFKSGLSITAQDLLFSDDVKTLLKYKLSNARAELEQVQSGLAGGEGVTPQTNTVDVPLTKNSSDKDIIDALKANGYPAPTKEQIEWVKSKL